MSHRPEIPEQLRRLADQPRVLVRRDGAPREDGRCVIYWMQRAMRVLHNPALDVAIEAANILALPVVIYFSIASGGPDTNVRHDRFVAQGLRDVAEDAAGRGIGFVLRRSPDRSLEAFLDEVEAALLVGDENPLREPERARQLLAKRIKLPYWTVDADVVVPSHVFGRDYFLLHHFRPHLKKELTKYLVAPEEVAPQHPWKPARALRSEPINEHIAMPVSAAVPVDSFAGGTHAALKRLRVFVHDELEQYEHTRNRPELKGTSRLSPYLHYGQISPLTIALAVNKAAREKRATAQAAEKFLDQLIGWRELSVLFVRYNQNYDNWECAEPWARKSLLAHALDPRPWRYALAQLERAETHDELWNAAQREMVDTGWMHNYMRMYWAKKILEWAPDPASAFDWAVILNDKYQLDGRDPNGYAGIAWAIVGKHDRPWFDRPIFGLVRTMTGKSLTKKLDAAAYIRQNAGDSSRFRGGSQS